MTDGHATVVEGVVVDCNAERCTDCAADLDGNGSFDASDASLILMYAAYSGAGGELGITEFLAKL
mgnify:CR=1 FL=1